MIDTFTGWVKRHAPSPSTNHLIVGAIVVSVLILSLAGATLVFTVQGKTSADATRSFEASQEQSDRIASCRATYSAELITGPVANGLKALAEHGADSNSFRQALGAVDPAEFVRLSNLSETHPDAFLKRCARDHPR